MQFSHIRLLFRILTLLIDSGVYTLILTWLIVYQLEEQDDHFSFSYPAMPSAGVLVFAHNSLRLKCALTSLSQQTSDSYAAIAGN